MKRFSLVVWTVFAVGLGATALRADQVFYFPRVSQTQPQFGNGSVPPYTELDQLVGLSFVADENPARVVLDVVGDNGFPLVGADITNRYQFDLAPHAWNAFYAIEKFGVGVLGKRAYIRATVTGGTVAAQYQYFNEAFTKLTGQAPLAAGQASKRLLFAYARRTLPGNGSVAERTEIDLINPNGTVANVKFSVVRPYDGSGIKKTTVTGTIPPFGKWQRPSDELFFSNFTDGYYFEVVADVPLLGAQVYTNNIQRQDGLENRWMTALNGLDPALALTQKGITVFAPHAVNTDGWLTRLILWDVGDRNGMVSSMLPQVSFLDRMGRPVFTGSLEQFEVRLGEMKRFSIESFVNQGFNGSMSYYAMRLPDHPDQGLVAELAFVSKEGGFEVRVPPIAPSRKAVLAHVAQGEFAPGRSFGSGIAVLNTGSAANSVTCTLYGRGGELVAERNFSLQSGEKFSLTHPEIFPAMPSLQLGGHVVVAGIQTFQCFGLYWVLDDGKIIATSIIPPQ